ncbi:hypothetical protein B0I21_106159 [Sphingobacterium paludis]|uniref:Uncharacterized protein n=1 Tax=Sphingobacterium paludis TaxID=1476465 RepID=A0A4R7CX78_9SPHI|nr:hypothetical protein B0I21_106159 [Sphingobacterium paludis]
MTKRASEVKGLFESLQVELEAYRSSWKRPLSNKRPID